MKSRSEHHASATGDAGYTLLEMLIVLSIIAVALAAAASLGTGPGARAQLRADAAALRDQAAMQRLSALARGTPVAWIPDPPEGARLDGCGGQDLPAELIFLPDGSARPATLCLTRGQAQARLTLDWLTGLLDVEEIP